MIIALCRDDDGLLRYNARMSQNPGQMPPPPPPPGGNPPPPAGGPPQGFSGAMPPGMGMQQRSSIPKVLGIIGIIYGVLGGLLSLASMLQGGLQLVLAVIGLGLAGFLIFASVQLLNYKRQGVTLTKIWALASIVLAIVGAIVGIMFINSAEFTAQATSGMTEEERQQMQQMGEGVLKGAGFAWIGCITVFRLVLPIIDLLLLGKQSVEDSVTD